MKYRRFALLLGFIMAIAAMLQGTNALAEETQYTQTVCPLERNVPPIC